MLIFLSDYALPTILLGVGATLFMDAWAWLQYRLFKAPALNYALVGRWLGHGLRGQLRHQSILAAVPITHEQALGWAAHYAIGVLFAALHLVAFGPLWLAHPTLWPALGSGLISLAAPFLVFQPCFGFGIAAAKTLRPWLARGKSLLGHLAFGLGLYVSAWVLS